MKRGSKAPGGREAWQALRSNPGYRAGWKGLFPRGRQERLQRGLSIGRAPAMTKRRYLDTVQVAASGGVSRITKNFWLRP